MEPVFVTDNLKEALAAADILEEQQFDWEFIPDFANPFIGSSLGVIPSFILAVPGEQARQARQLVQPAEQPQGEKP